MLDPDNNLACQELVELLTDYLDDKLPERERARFEAHVGACSGCQAYVEQMRQTLRTLGELSAADVSPDALQQLLAAYRAWQAESI